MLLQNEKAESYKISRAVGQSVTSSVDRDFMANRTVKLLGQKTFGNRWFTMNEQEKLEFSSKLGAKSNREEIKSYLTRRYGRTEAENFDYLPKRL